MMRDQELLCIAISTAALLHFSCIFSFRRNSTVVWERRGLEPAPTPVYEQPKEL
jgi:hypothetical protein